MADFCSEKLVKSVQKARQCEGCGRKIEVGSDALNCAGYSDGQFWSASYHTECRAAEIALNDLHRTRFDEWMNLCSDMEYEDWPWLAEVHPVVAERMGITMSRYEKIHAERERIRLAWIEIDKRSDRK